jgi:predicted amidohydrolase YtcJ
MDADAADRSVKRLISASLVCSGPDDLGDAVLVEDGRVVAIGQATALRSDADEVIEHPGAVIVPGFRDAHIHAVPYASLLSGCSLKSATSMNDLIDRLAAYAATLDGDHPVVATRLDDESLAERRLPTRHDLDRAVPDRPAVIYRYCGHIAVANSAALEASNIGVETADPEGGSLDRVDGMPNGILRETAAGLIAPALARGGHLEPSDLLDALHVLAGLGITSIGAMMGYGEQPSHTLEAEIDVWTSIAGDLPIKVHGITITDDPDVLTSAAGKLDDAGGRLRWHGVKRFADGSLGGHTAAMHTPFADVDTTGTYRLTEADVAIARTAAELGGAVCIHAIGDRAVSGVLDTFDVLISEGVPPERLRMEHVSVVSPDQIDRFAAMGVSACVQPAFIASESEWLFTRVGDDRSTWVYPFASMAAAGIPLVGSSDCPVEPPHPLWGMAAAIDRHGILPSEALSGSAALDLFTTAGAMSLGEPEPLTPGAPADMVVLDRDVRSVEPDQVHETHVIETYVDGAAVVVDRSAPAWVD